jgi:hypothetical protein
MNTEFLNREQSLELKILGFDYACFAYYDSDGLQIRPSNGNPENKNSLFTDDKKTNNPKCSAPLKQQAFRFFREKFGLDYYIDSAGLKDKYQAFVDGYIYSSFLGEKYKEGNPIHFSYENAEIACIDRLIELAYKKV